jgi:DNA ligase-1
MQATTSAVMSHDGPDPRDGGFSFHVFDRIDMPAEPFHKRLGSCVVRASEDPVVRLLHHTIISTAAQLAEFEQDCVSAGFEGIMLRDPNGRYKFGRSTLKEGILLKVKQFDDDEAELAAMVELNRNLNEATVDERGYTKRSTSKDGKVAAGVMGAMVLRSPKWTGTFEIGSGFTAEQRADFWERREELLGQLVCFKHQPSGAKDKPRFPVFKGFRHVDDL